MLLKKSIRQVKNVIQKRLRNLKSLVSKRRNQNQLSKAPSFNAIPSSNNSTKMQLNRDISQESINDDDEVVDTRKSKSVTRSITKDWNTLDRSFISNGERSASKATKEEGVKQEKKIAKERGYQLAEKLKELEMVNNAYHKDHVMDVEEALHYYSLITCPVYQEIVDRFFMDMYSESLLSQPSASMNNSMRRGQSIRL